MTNDHKPSSLKQHRSIILQCWWSEVQMGSFRGRNIFLTFSSFSSCLNPLAHGFFHLQMQQYLAESLSHGITLTLTLLPPCSPRKDSCLIITLKDLDNPGQHPTQNIPTSAFCHIRQCICRFWRLGCAHPCGPLLWPLQVIMSQVCPASELGPAVEEARTPGILLLLLVPPGESVP